MASATLATHQHIAGTRHDTRYDSDSRASVECTDMEHPHRCWPYGLEISASQWHSCVLAILRCWRPICTILDVETPPFVHIAMVLMKRQNIWCYTVQRTIRRGRSGNPRCLWSFLERIGEVTRHLIGNERESSSIIEN